MKGILIDAGAKEIRHVEFPTETAKFNVEIKKLLGSTSVISAPTDKGHRMIYCDQNCLSNPANPAFKFEAARQIFFERVLITGWNTIRNERAKFDNELSLEKVIAMVTFLSPKESRKQWSIENYFASRLCTDPN